LKRALPVVDSADSKATLEVVAEGSSHPCLLPPPKHPLINPKLVDSPMVDSVVASRAVWEVVPVVHLLKNALSMKNSRLVLPEVVSVVSKVTSVVAVVDSSPPWLRPPLMHLLINPKLVDSLMAGSAVASKAVWEVVVALVDSSRPWLVLRQMLLLSSR
jgi:hypothetical protein